MFASQLLSPSPQLSLQTNGRFLNSLQFIYFYTPEASKGFSPCLSDKGEGSVMLIERKKNFFRAHQMKKKKMLAIFSTKFQESRKIYN